MIASASVWDEIQDHLDRHYALPHNTLWLRERNVPATERIAQQMAEIRSGFRGTPERVEVLGPQLFLRVAGPANAAFGGLWWFDAKVLDSLGDAYRRIFFTTLEKDAAIRNLLREGLAISHDFHNAMTEVWALEVPAGKKLVTYTGPGAPHRLFGSLPLSAIGNRMLVGRVRQHLVLVKNPLWITQYRNLLQ